MSRVKRKNSDKKKKEKTKKNSFGECKLCRYSYIDILEVVIEGIIDQIVDGVENFVDEKMRVEIQGFEDGLAFAAFHFHSPTNFSEDTKRRR